MGALKALAAALALAAATSSFGAGAREGDSVRGSERWRVLAGEAADRFGLPAEWVMRVIEAESGGRTLLGGEPITSHAGAMGLMQIMPATWASLRAQYSLGADPHDPRDNIVAGTAYLRAMYDLFGYPGLFGAYNAGPGRYRDYVAGGRPLPRETRDYIAKITGAAPPRARLPGAPGSPRTSRRVAVAGSGAAVAAAAADPIFLSRKSPPGVGLSPAKGERAPGARSTARGLPQTTSDAPMAALPGEGTAPGDGIFVLRGESAKRHD